MSRAVPILPATSLSLARDFYVGRLGFTLSWEWSPDEGITGLLGLKRDGMRLTIDCPMTGHGRDACVSLEVEDVDAFYDEWREKIDIRRPPKNETWGARTFDVVDPFGNTIYVMGPAV